MRFRVRRDENMEYSRTHAVSRALSGPRIHTPLAEKMSTRPSTRSSADGPRPTELSFSVEKHLELSHRAEVARLCVRGLSSSRRLMFDVWRVCLSMKVVSKVWRFFQICTNLTRSPRSPVRVHPFVMWKPLEAHFVSDPSVSVPERGIDIVLVFECLK